MYLQYCGERQDLLNDMATSGSFPTFFLRRGATFVSFSPFSTVITSPGEERANLSAFRTFVRFALVWFCLFPLPLRVWDGLRLVIVALPRLVSYLFFKL